MRAQPTQAQRRQEALISTVAAVLDRGEPTRFADEGACCHGVRLAFVVASWRWQNAEEAAASLFNEALRRLRVSRPSWAAGQREYVEPVGGEYLQCVERGKPLSPRGYTGPPRKFCDVICRTAQQERKRRQSGKEVSRAG